MKSRIFVLSIAWICLVSSSVFAMDRLVPSVYPTIQAGIDAAENGDVVIVAAGTYTGSGNKDLDFGGKAITVRSSDPEDPNVVAATIIDCENDGRGFYFHSGETASSVVAGLTITNGHADGGGGIYCNSSSPTTRNCIFSGNRAWLWGGGMENSNCSPTVTNCVFTGNIAESHYAPCDFDIDWDVDLFDLKTVADRWLERCRTGDWCEGRDINKSSRVDFFDFTFCGEDWLVTGP